MGLTRQIRLREDQAGTPTQVREAAEMTFDEIKTRVRAAVEAKFKKPGDQYCFDAWLNDCYEDRCIYRAPDGKLYQAGYTVADDGEITLGEPVEVVGSYTPISEDLREALHPQLIREVAEGGQRGREWEVLLIEAGVSGNGNHYPAEVLRKAAPLFEGTDAYADHVSDASRRAGQTRSIRDKVGRFHQVEFGRWDVGGRVVEGLRARFRVVVPWLREMLLESFGADETDFVGFSIDAEGKVSVREHQGRRVRWVEEILRVHSTDVVANPAAGGRPVRLVAGQVPPNTPEEERAMNPEQIQALVESAARAAVAAAAPALATATATALREAGVVAAPAVPAAPAAPETPPAPPQTVSLTEDEVRQFRVERARAAAVERVNAALQGVNLSEASRERVRRDFADLATRRDFDDAELTARVQEEVSHEAALIQQYIRPGQVSHATGMVAPADKNRNRLIAMFLGEKHEDCEPFRGLREAYCRWTGADPFDVSPFEIAGSFAGRYDSAVDHKKLQESLSNASWSQVYADVFYIVMMKAYRDSPAYNRWRTVVSDIESPQDFRTRHFARVGGYGDLDTVAEQGTYPQLTTPGDEEITYAVAKRGGIEDLTFEAIVNDRIGAIRRIPGNMGRAAARTLFKFVMNLLTTDNPTMEYDSVALYHASHGNTSAVALAVSGLNTVQIAMRDQTAFGESAEILGERNKIKILVVPNELEQRALRITNPSGQYHMSPTGDTDTSIDPLAFAGKGIEVLPYDQLTDADDWYAVADPREVNTLVVGFLNGQQEPELFVQDQPNVGSVFTADKIAYKVRHIYGGDVLDHRSFYKATQ